MDPKIVLEAAHIIADAVITEGNTIAFTIFVIGILRLLWRS